MSKKSHCSRGHLYTETTTRVTSTGKRVCKTCNAENMRNWRADKQVGNANSRKTHCKQGHEYTDSNTLYTVRQNGRTRRNCRECGRQNSYNQRYKRYGINKQIFEELMGLQNRSCAICTQKFVKPPHIDHDHVTGSVRGLLCFSCNSAIGHFKDSSDILKRAAIYLDKFTKTEQKN